MGRHNKTKKIRTSAALTFHETGCCEATMHGLEIWYKHLFQKLGWMILAKNRGFMDKITLYKTDLARFKEAIDHKVKVHVKEIDHKQDLMIMHHNVCLLIEHVNKDF
jgi:hypothetical protein